MKSPRVIVAGLFALALAPVVASAHNAGHLTLPDGTCHEIGSFRESPLVGQDRTPLDLAPETPNPPFDEYGVSYVGHLRLGPISPGPCQAPRAIEMTADPGAFASFPEMGFM